MSLLLLLGGAGEGAGSAVRRFDGEGDAIKAYVGAADVGSSDMTAAFLFRRATNGAVHTLAAWHSHSETVRHMVYLTASNKLGFRDSVGNDAGWTAFDWAGAGWVLVGVSKPAGLATPRFHRYVFATETWTHGDGDDEVGDAAGSSETLWLGGANEFGSLNGDMAATMVLGEALDDASFESLFDVDELVDWLDRDPSGLWLLKQGSVEDLVIDYTYNGADARAVNVVGTSVLATDPPIPYGTPPQPPSEFRGDFETGDTSQFESMQSIPERLTIVERSSPGSPVAQGHYAARFEIQEGDEEPATGSRRSELISGRRFYGGESRYFRIRGRVDSWDADPGRFTIIWQVHDDGGGSPPLSLQVVGTEEEPRLWVGGFGKDKYWEAPFEIGTYFEVILHVEFGEAGSVEVWLDRVQQTLEGGGTIVEGDTAGLVPSYDKLGGYCSTAMVGTTVIYHDDYLVSAVFPPEEASETVPAARVTNEPVDDRLFIEISHADGTTTRWAGDEPDASGIPMGIKTSTSAPGGYRDASWSMARDPRRRWPDMSLVDDVVIRGRTRPLGRNAFEGQTSQFPSDLGDTVAISVNAVGHQSLLSDNEHFRALYVKLGAEGWGDAPLWRKQQIAAGYPQGKIQAGVSGGGLVWDVPAETIPTNEHAEQWWEAPAGLGVRKLGYRGKRIGDFSKFEAALLQGTDSETTATGGGELSASLTLDDTPRVAELSAARRRLFLRLLSTGEGLPAANTQQSFSAIAEYGDHGLTLRDIEGALPGLYGHDVLGHMLETGAPDLNFDIGGDGTIIPNQSVVLPDLAFMEGGTVKAALEKLNAYFLNNYAVWDDKTFYWQPWDPSRLTWDVSVAGGGKWSPAGRQAETLLNGIVVSYTDAYGVARTAGPPGSGCDYQDASLADSDPNNPYTRRGRRRWGNLSVGFPLAYPATAIQVGAVFMAESKFPQRSGTLVVRPKGKGHIPEIQHPTMGPLPVWAMRAGDYAQLVDWPDPEPFRVISTDYEGDSKTLIAQLDTGAARLSAMLERVGVRLTGIG